MLNTEYTEELVDEERVDFPSVTVEGSNSFPCENWNNVCRIKMSLMITNKARPKLVILCYERPGIVWTY